MADRGNLLIGGIAVLGVVGGAWLLTNYEPQRIGIIFTTLSIISLIVAVGAGAIGRFLGNNAGSGSTPDLQLKRQVAIGAGAGLIILFFSFFTPFTIGLPSVNYSVGTSALSVGAAKAFISIVVAPVVEEVFFLFVVPFLLFSWLLGAMKNRILATGVTLLAASALFALFHYLAYGSTLLVSAAFIGAAIFRLITLVIVLVRGGTGFQVSSVAPVIVTTIIMHMIFNAAVYSQQLIITGV